MDFVKISTVRPGDVVQFVAGFPCIGAGDTRVVKRNPSANEDAKRFGCFSDYHALYVDCACGGHLIEAQSDFKGDNDCLIGIVSPGTIAAAFLADKQHPLPNFYVRKVSAHVFDPENYVNHGLLRECRGGESELGPYAKASGRDALKLTATTA